MSLNNKNSLLWIAGTIVILGLGIAVFIQPNVWKGADKALVLEAGGIGVINFGAAQEEALSELTQLLGTPSKDTGWIDSFSVYGTCPGERIRVAEWNRLKVFFGDTAFGRQAFFHYEYTDRDTNNPVPQLATAKGVTLGMNKSEVLSRYPNARIEPMELAEGVEYLHLVSPSDTGAYLGGTLKDGKVFWISGGMSCGE